MWHPGNIFERIMTSSVATGETHLPFRQPMNSPPQFVKDKAAEGSAYHIEALMLIQLQ